jgi:hypothetical protein
MLTALIPTARNLILAFVAIMLAQRVSYVQNLTGKAL